MEQNRQENPNLFEKLHNPLEVTTIKAQNSKKKTNKNVVLVNQGLNCIIEHKSILFFFSLKGKFLELKNEKMEKTGMERKCRLLRYSFTRRVI